LTTVAMPTVSRDSHNTSKMRFLVALLIYGDHQMLSCKLSCRFTQHTCIFLF